MRIPFLLALLVLFSVSSPGEVLAITPTPIQLAVKGFLLSANDSANVLPWSIQADSRATLPINWKTVGLGEAGGLYTRQGTLEISVNGQTTNGQTTTQLQRRVEIVPWDVALYGPHAGVEEVTLSSRAQSAELDIVGALRLGGLSLKVRKCSWNAGVGNALFTVQARV
jgi:hypothetical protein